MLAALAAGGIYLVAKKTRPAAAAVADAGPAAPPAPATAPDVIGQLKDSTVYIRCTHGRGQVSSGTGFFAGEPGYVLTNAHVVGYHPRASSARPKRSRSSSTAEGPTSGSWSPASTGPTARPTWPCWPWTRPACPRPWPSGRPPT